MLLRIVGVFLGIVAWHLVVLAAHSSLLPYPMQVLQSARQNATILMHGSLATTVRLLQGLVSGFAIATALAIAAARWGMVRHLIDGPVEFLRPIPPIALTPLFIVLLGIDDLAQVSLIGLGTFMVFYVGWLEALRRTPAPLLNSARSLGYGGLRLILAVAIPYAWPAQKPIWRLSIATGLALSVAAEYLGAQGGLGYVIRNARTVLDLSLIAAASIILGAIAIVIDQLATLTIDATSRWSSKNGRLDA